MNAKEIRTAVQSYRERTAQGSTVEHCFAPWFLNQQFQLPETKAGEQCSDGANDFGLDAFALTHTESGSTLALIQSKFTESLQQINGGFKDLARAVPEVVKALDATGSDLAVENKVLVNLRAALNRLSEETRKALRLEFIVLHLSEEDGVILSSRTEDARTRLKEVAQEYLPSTTFSIKDVAPRDLGPRQLVVVPPEKSPLRLEGVQTFKVGEGTRMFWAVGRLANLVELYSARRDQLFSKNVRYFLTSRKNTEKGPAGKMRATLKQMVVEKKLEPETFALFHNGVTIYASRLEIDGQGASVYDPYVLNGCQTIKNAFFFKNDPVLRSRIDPELWERVAVPVRIIETRDEELVRTVTTNNNRQNSISFAALRANDPVQIRLEERFRTRGIFYERQEGAYKNLESSSPEVLEDEYENTRGQAVEIDDLARCLAAVAGEINLADRVADIFESDAAYNRCFSAKRLGSIAFLVFLQNLNDVLGVILKKDLDLSPKGGGPKPGRLKYPTMCLVVRHLARERDRDFILRYGDTLVGRGADFRDDIASLIRSRGAGIKSALARHFMTLDSSGASEMKAAFEACEKDLRLKPSIDAFEEFGDLDKDAEPMRDVG